MRSFFLVTIGAAMLATLSPIRASDIRYPNDGIIWITHPDGDEVGNCFSNCGAGCADTNNPCGGRDQYWELDIISGPNQISDATYPECNGAAFVMATYDRYSAVGRWTYYGYSAYGCYTHDYFCGIGSLYVGCAAFVGCGSGGNDEWSYDDGITGRVLQSYFVVEPYWQNCLTQGYP